MDGFFTAPQGPGPVGDFQGGGVGGLIAPHIDFHRGGPAYAWAYRDLAERCDADLFVIFGTCHAGMADPFALTRKDYDTPFGPARVDRDVVDALAARARQDCFGSELAHRNEHSIEFQAVFLQLSLRRPARHPHRSGAHQLRPRGAGARPASRTTTRGSGRFLDALAELAGSGRRVAFIAGADLAHVGPRFGDPQPVSPAELGTIDREDREMLRAVEAGDAEGFFESVRRRRRPAAHLRPVADLHAAARARRRQGAAAAVRPVAGSAGRRQLRQRRLPMSAASAETPPSEWRLPKLRIDVDGDWFDDDVQITHPGILANLRGNLRKDGDGHFIQTRVRIPVEVADAPFVVTRVERRGDTLHLWLNDGSEEDVAASRGAHRRGRRAVQPGQGRRLRGAAEPGRRLPVPDPAIVSVATGGQHVVDALRAEGVRTVFGIPGFHNLAIYDALLAPGRDPPRAGPARGRCGLHGRWLRARVRRAGRGHRDDRARPPPTP